MDGYCVVVSLVIVFFLSFTARVWAKDPSRQRQPNSTKALAKNFSATNRCRFAFFISTGFVSMIQKLRTTRSKSDEWLVIVYS